MQDDERSGRTPAFGVCFESYDSFLVEYTECLRHGRLRLPLAQPLARGTAVRLKVGLPDGHVMYLTGHVEGPDPREDCSLVELDPLTAEQDHALQHCLERMMFVAEAPPVMEEPERPAAQVLLVDDAVSVRIELGDALRARGLRVRVAENGLEGLAAALKRPPDLILTDVSMPIVDGWQFLRMLRVRRQLAAVPVVFLTRLDDEMSRLRGYRLGIDDFLPKTVAPDEIVARIHGVLLRNAKATRHDRRNGIRGDLEHVRAASILSFLESERRSGELHLERGADSAVLHLHEGALVHVERLGSVASALERVFELLDWRQGTFEFFARSSTQAHPQRSEPILLHYVLMEHARRQDESRVAQKA